MKGRPFDKLRVSGKIPINPKASAYQGKPVNLDDIIEAIEAGTYRFTDHGKAEAANDGLTEAEITFSVIHGEML